MASMLKRHSGTVLKLAIVFVIATAIAIPWFVFFNHELKLVEYEAARQQFEKLAQPYWELIGEKRRLRNAKHIRRESIAVDDYVLIQPPTYTGPSRPVSPLPKSERPSQLAPTIRDFLKHALEQFQVTPTEPKTEIEFKKAYAKVAAAAGLTKAQVVRVYAFESGGDGKYDVQAGLEYDTPNAHAISTALGYNQLLNNNSVELMAEQGNKFLDTLNTVVSTLNGDAEVALERKIDVVRRMIEFSRSVPDEWARHEEIANTPRGFGVHAMNLDIDVGPLLQVQKLLDSVIFGQKKGYGRELTAAELEMMNLTGDGNGFDMVSMPIEIREKVPTSNFFQRKGYEVNSVAIRNNTVAKLIAATDTKMDEESKLQGAKDLAAAF
jgi:hypothetical protein